MRVIRSTRFVWWAAYFSKVDECARVAVFFSAFTALNDIDIDININISQPSLKGLHEAS